MGFLDRMHEERGGVVKRILLFILAMVLILFGVILAIASVGVAIDDDRSILILLPFAIAIIIGGLVILAIPFKYEGREAMPTTQPPAADSTSASTEPTTREVQPATEPQPAGREVQPAAVPQPSAHEAQPAAPSPESTQPTAPRGATEDIAHLVFRSNDLFATLRDLVRHGETGTSEHHHLADMLMAAGVMDWSDAPACEAVRLTRNSHFWIRLSADDLSASQYDTLISAEAALGINQDLPDVRSLPLGDQRTQKAALQLMHDLCDQTIDSCKLLEEGLRACYHASDPAVSPTSQWQLRTQVIHAAECARTPFRVTYDVRADACRGVAVLSLEVPRPRCMAVFTADATEQANLARAYALRLSTLLARLALVATPHMQRVVVNCHEHESLDTILSLDVTVRLLENLLPVVRSAKLDTAFPRDRAIRVALDGASWLDPVEPFLTLDNPEVTPADALILPELDRRESPEIIQQTCHAKRICDLGINENASRIAAWHEVRPQLTQSTTQAVSALVSLRDRTQDITVAEACTRTIQALVEGQVDLDDLGVVAELFIDGSTLDRNLARAIDLLEGDDGQHPDPEAAIALLEKTLAPIDDMGAYLDDAHTVYRYFGSVSERLHHNAAVNEGGREICLVPDAYFNAHSNASIALGMLERYDEALAHADVCLRLAPTSTYATMRKVRVLEAQSRIYEAADLIVAALHHAVTPRDAAICHYRLAYMEWKLGREDLATACYQRSLAWDTEMSSAAREELDDLLEANPDLKRPTAEEAEALLAREGIPLGCAHTTREHTLAAAVACIDSNRFIPARPLIATLFAMNNDDVLMGLYRSLSVSV